MNCDYCHKDLPKGRRWKISQAPTLARFCFDCYKNNLAGFWHLKDIYQFVQGGWRKSKVHNPT